MNRREALQSLLSRALGAAGTVLLGSAALQAAPQDEAITTVEEDVRKRADQLAAQGQTAGGEEPCSFLNTVFGNGGFSNAPFFNTVFGNGGFRNAPFFNHGFRNGGFGNGFGNHGFRNHR